MSHELEIINGNAQMAYSGDVPWHGLGVKVPSDLTPIQMLDAAGLNWKVYTEPCYATVNEKQVETGHSVLVRDSDHSVLDVITDDWHPMQNEDAFNFFNDFIAAGDMEMHTAGSLKDGRIIWALAKVHESFELFGGRDRVDSYLHFTNPHTYGKSIDIRFTPIRVVCNNTLTLSLSMKSKNVVKVSHRREFDEEQVKEYLGVAHDRFSTYKETAEYLSKRRAKDEDVVEYFKRIFPVTSKKVEEKKPELSRNAKLAIEVLNTQPGADVSEGTWWNAFNAITYMTDHLIGRSADTRLQSAWYGSNQNMKIDALKLAAEMAEA